MISTYQTQHTLQQTTTCFLKTCFALLVRLTLVLSLSAQAEESLVELEEAQDFAQLAADMRESDRPLLLSFDAEHCHYCKRLTAEHLQPMLNNEEYTQRILIHSLTFDGGQEVTDFDEKILTASDLSDRYKIRLTPTLLFLNDKGEEIAERILGYNTPEFYGAYLDRAIDKAVKTVTP